MSNVVVAIIGFLFGWFVLHPIVKCLRRDKWIRAELAMARLMIAELAPKAKAWDDAQAVDAWPLCSLGHQLAARAAGDTRVQYQHLSAECSDDE